VKSKAAIFRGPGKALDIREIDLDEPGPRDVLVRMAAVGICGTDLHSIRGEWTRPTPIVLGHEGAGVVEAVGAEVESVLPGDEVVLSWAPACGRCADCRRGRPAACIELHRAIGAGTLVDGTTGISLDGETLYRGTATGAMSEHVVVTERVALPTGGGSAGSSRIGSCAATSPASSRRSSGGRREVEGRDLPRAGEGARHQGNRPRRARPA
jgi:S-(hydroxymethyl)glutathione dehydrogenase / alcohol dehydrogenase